jgi:hypothetical protein
MFRGKGKDINNVWFTTSLCVFLCLSWCLSPIFDVAFVFANAPVFTCAFARHRRWPHFYTKMLSFTPTWRWLDLLSWSWLYLIFFLFCRRRNGDWQNWQVHLILTHIHPTPNPNRKIRSGMDGTKSQELFLQQSNVIIRCPLSLCALTGLGLGLYLDKGFNLG